MSAFARTFVETTMSWMLRTRSTNSLVTKGVCKGLEKKDVIDSEKWSRSWSRGSYTLDLLQRYSATKLLEGPIDTLLTTVVSIVKCLSSSLAELKSRLRGCYKFDYDALLDVMLLIWCITENSSTQGLSSSFGNSDRTHLADRLSRLPRHPSNIAPLVESSGMHCRVGEKSLTVLFGPTPHA